MKQVSSQYFLPLAKYSLRESDLRNLYADYEGQEEYNEWEVLGRPVSYGFVEFPRVKLAELSLSFPLPISRCSFAIRSRGTYYTPHKDRGGRAAILIYNFSEDKSPLGWYKTATFDDPILFSTLDVPTLINTQKDYHGIEKVSEFKRVTMQIEFGNLSYEDLFAVFSAEKSEAS